MKPVLVDTSVWRQYFRGNASVKGLSELLAEDKLVVLHPWVLGELTLGGLSAREEHLLAYLPASSVVPHGEVLQFVRRRGLSRRGIGWVDVNVLASAISSSSTLWTLDSDLFEAATELRAAF